jgi:hypothetical protein
MKVRRNDLLLPAPTLRASLTGMSKRAPVTIPIITSDGEHHDLPAKWIESLRWREGRATLTTVTEVGYDVIMDLPAYNALVADWALSAPGRTRGLQFAIRAQARAGRLTGAEAWPRNKSPHAYGRPSVGRPAKA